MDGTLLRKLVLPPRAPCGAKNRTANSRAAGTERMIKKKLKRRLVSWTLEDLAKEVGAKKRRKRHKYCRQGGGSPQASLGRNKF